MPGPRLFRQEALNAHLQEIEGKGILKVSPFWSWAVLVSFGSLILMAGVFSVLGKVEITGRGPGILRPVGGVRRLMAPGPGVVAEVLVHPGDRVKAGDPILRMDFSELLGSVLEADQALRARGQAFGGVARSQALLFDQQIRTAEAQVLSLTREISSYSRVRDRAQQRLTAHQELYRLGLIGRLEVHDHEDQLEAAQRAVAAGEQSLSQAKQERMVLEAQRREQTWSQSAEQAQARTRRDSLAFRMRENLITSPVDGIVDGLVLSPGDQVLAGALVAKVVPTGTALRGVAFLDEKDRAFVKEGDWVALELARAGRAPPSTKVTLAPALRTDLASSTEMMEAFGTTQALPEIPSFKVLIRLEPAVAGKLARMPLRSGTILKARFTLRRQRLITIVIEPLQRWFP